MVKSPKWRTQRMTQTQPHSRSSTKASFLDSSLAGGNEDVAKMPHKALRWTLIITDE